MESLTASQGGVARKVGTAKRNVGVARDAEPESNVSDMV